MQRVGLLGVLGPVDAVGSTVGSRKASRQGRIDGDGAVCLDLGIGSRLDLDNSSVAVMVVVVVQWVTGGLARGEDGRRVGGVGRRDGRGRGRDGVGDGGGRRDVAVVVVAGGGLDGAAATVAATGRLLLLEDGIVAETLSLGLLAVVAGGVSLVALDWGLS